MNNTKKHGQANTRIYYIWNHMKQRCYNPNDCHYKNYGGRGIKMCDEWKNDFKAFYDWAIRHNYDDSLTIDRKDNDGDYCPKNCHWASIKYQQNNKRTNKYIVFNEKKRNVSQWAAEFGISASVLHNRLFNYGWDFERAITTPIRKRRTKQ